MELRFEDWPLNEDEMLFREAYRKGPSSLWEQPMTYSAYEQYRQEGKVVVTTHSNRYRDNTLGARGVTVEEVAGPIQARLAVHSRYSYPILHNHNYVEIVYVASGQCVNLFETTSFPMKAGDVCILSPNAMHAISCTRDDTCVLNMMVNRTFFTKQFLHLLRGRQGIGGLSGGDSVPAQRQPLHPLPYRVGRMAASSGRADAGGAHPAAVRI